MLNLKDQESTVFSSEREESGQYKSVSRMAVAGLVIGGFSFVALFHPLLWLVPLLAIAVSLLSLCWTLPSASEVTGKTIAVTGITCAAFFGTWAIAEYAASRYLLYSTARQYADQWLDMVQEGRLQKAFELHKEFRDRQSEKANLEQYYGSVEEAQQMPENKFLHELEQRNPKQAFGAFWSKQPLRAMAMAGREGKIQFVRYGQSWESSGMVGLKLDNLLLTYRFVPPGEGSQPVTFELQMERSHFVDTFIWRVERVVLVEE